MNLDGAVGTADRPAEQGPERDVRVHERRPPGRRHAVAGPDRSRLPERAGVCERPHPDAQPVGPEGAGQAGRPDHRAPGRAPHAADRQGLCRRRARADLLRRAADRPRTEPPGRRSAQGSRRRSRAADPDRQGLHHRQRLDRHLGSDAGVRRPRLHQRVGHGAVRARRPHQHDLRRHQHHPVARPAGPQDPDGQRRQAARVRREDQGLRRRERPGRVDVRVRHARWANWARRSPS